jgi:hypothetical protein
VLQFVSCCIQEFTLCCSLLSRSSRAMRDFLLFSLCHIQPN